MDQDQGVGRQVKKLREERGWSQTRLAVEADMSVSGISMIENGHRNLSTATLAKLATALGVEVRDLFPLAQPPLDLIDVREEERRSDWEARVNEARRLRESGWDKMWRLLSEWRASKAREEPYAARRKHLDEMGSLLQEVYDADAALGKAYLDAALTLAGGSDADVARYLQEESRAAGHFYGELFGLVKSAGLSIDTGAGAGNAKEAHAEKGPHRIEESPAA